MTNEGTHSIVPFRPGFLSGNLADPGSVRLAGSRCNACGIALFGERHRCENCSSRELTHESFAATGKIHTYTVQRYAPPPPHSLPLPWEPRPIAWVDLDENGPRILAPIGCTPDEIEIGMSVRLECRVAWTEESGDGVIAYGFVPARRAGDAE